MSRRKSGLGKGLGALIPDAQEDGVPTAKPTGLTEVPLASITPNPHQPRSPIRDQDVVELAASIQEHGIIQPLVVNQTPDGHQLIAGERRWRAARLAGLTTVPVVVKDVAPREMLELALVENLQRADLNPLEEAIAYRQLVDEFYLTQDQVARRVGKSRAAISNTMRLLKAAPVVQEALTAGKISEGHARALMGLEKFEAQENALKIVLKQGLNVRQTEELVRRLLGVPQEEKPPRPVSPQTRALEANFRQALGTKVNLARGNKGGRVVIYFYSDEELESLYERIVGSEE
ncbi:MAG: ParB/RepB/Spo0J family partition protein [Chloroflexi bacterium]|nr:ParB/RepB/Spo0J family partition protein [Chloroflexota bacterium]